MKNAYLDHFGSALGQTRIDLATTVSERNTRTALAPLRSAGFGAHHIAAPTESAYDLAHRAVSSIAARLGRIDLLVYASCLPSNANAGDVACFTGTRDVKHLMDYPASRLQAAFELSHAAVVGISQQGCTGMLGAIRIAKAMLADDPTLRRSLCVTSDRFPEGALYEQSYSLISDAATACTVAADEGAYRILSCHSFTVGGRSAANDDEMVGSFFNQTHKLIVEALAKAQMDISEVTRFIPQNANPKAWKVLARLLHVEDERFFVGTIADYGHAIGSDSILNLIALERSAPLCPGERALVFVTGTGMNWQSMILEKT